MISSQHYRRLSPITAEGDDQHCFWGRAEKVSGSLFTLYLEIAIMTMGRTWRKRQRRKRLNDNKNSRSIGKRNSSMLDRIFLPDLTLNYDIYPLAKEEEWEALRTWCKNNGMPKARLALAYFKGELSNIEHWNSGV